MADLKKGDKFTLFGKEYTVESVSSGEMSDSEIKEASKDINQLKSIIIEHYGSEENFVLSWLGGDDEIH